MRNLYIHVRSLRYSPLRLSNFPTRESFRTKCRVWSIWQIRDLPEDIGESNRWLETLETHICRVDTTDKCSLTRLLFLREIEHQRDLYEISGSF